MAGAVGIAELRERFAEARRLLVLGRGPSATEAEAHPRDGESVVVTDPSYSSRDVYQGDPFAVLIGDRSRVLHGVAERYLATAPARRPLLIYTYLPGEATPDFSALGLPRPAPIRPLLASAGLYEFQPNQPYPTSGVFMALLAAALDLPARVAGIDLYRHATGRVYANGGPVECAPPAWPERHSEACDVEHMLRIARRRGSKVEFLGVARQVIDERCRTRTINHADIAELAVQVIAGLGENREHRSIIGIVGIPGGGKSTLAAALVEALNEKQPGIAALLPMDGFHFTNQQLVEKGLRDRKGSPETFDVEAYLALLRAARTAGREVRYPVYDRAAHEPVWRETPEQMINRGVRIIVTEGNYLLLAREPWAQLASILDESWLLETPVGQAKQWILARHQRGGRTAESAAEHYHRVDRANTMLVLEQSRPCTRRLKWEV